MRMCEVIWNMEKADRVQKMVESASGLPCPCAQGLVCPLMPADVVLPPPLKLPVVI